MKQSLWQIDSPANALVEDYTSGDDIGLDQELVAYDIYGSLAHTQMLVKQKLLSQSDAEQIREVLLQLLADYEAGKFQLQAGDEDVHTRIESEITARYAQAGANLHIGRSRNDQVLTDLRLFSKQELLSVADLTLQLAQAFASRVNEEMKSPMPGYTHLQPAMVSSVGMWFAQFAESLLDDVSVLQTAFQLNDQSPLGSGAGYGVALPIDRAYTAKLLGFSKVQNNALYCQNSRGKIEHTTVHALGQIMQTLGRFATDLVVFTAHEYGYFSLPAELTTGSSIMPQKRNYDLVELLRAKTKTMLSYEHHIGSLITGLPSGYNRDLQEIKSSYLAAFTLIKKSLHIGLLCVTNLKIHHDTLLAHIGPEMFAAQWAYELMKQDGIPFREAYFKVKKNITQIPTYDAVEMVAKTQSQGAAGNLQLSHLNDQLAAQTKLWSHQATHFHQVLEKLTGIKKN